MEILIRRAVPGDADNLTALVEQWASENEEVHGLTPAYAVQYMGTPGSGILLAVAEGMPAGFLCYSLRPNLFHAAPSLFIEDLFVSPALRRQGLGRRLLAEAMALAQASGCAEISVSTGFQNERAQALYRAAGLTEEYILLERHF